MKFINFKILFVSMLFAGQLQAASAQPVRQPASGPSEVGVTKPLEIMGQNRNVTLMSNYKSGDVHIGFAKPRQNFRAQILSTVY